MSRPRKKIFCLFKCKICKKLFLPSLTQFYRNYKQKTALCSNKCIITNRKKRTEEKSPGWKNGRYQRKDGWIFIYKPSHPFNKDGYLLEHRLIMEKHIGRYLKPEEVIHHLNGNNSDNRIENLLLYKNHSEHIKKSHLLNKKRIKGKFIK